MGPLSRALETAFGRLKYLFFVCELYRFLGLIVARGRRKSPTKIDLLFRPDFLIFLAPLLTYRAKSHRPLRFPVTFSLIVAFRRVFFSVNGSKRWRRRPEASASTRARQRSCGLSRAPYKKKRRSSQKEESQAPWQSGRPPLFPLPPPLDLSAVPVRLRFRVSLYESSPEWALKYTELLKVHRRPGFT